MMASVGQGRAGVHLREERCDDQLPDRAERVGDLRSIVVLGPCELVVLADHDSATASQMALVSVYGGVDEVDPPRPGPDG
jgi:hypothetical protein